MTAPSPKVGATSLARRMLALVPALALTFAFGTGRASAGCGVESGALSLFSDDWEALHVVAERAEACAGDGVTVTTERTREHKALQVPALSVTPARYTSAVVSNNTIVPLSNADLIRPLDALIARHAPTLPDRQRIRIDGRTLAIAFNANVQHLYYREDVLERSGLEPPSSYEALLEGAETLRREGRFEHPLGGTFAAGWDLANEFFNLYLGLGGEPFVAGSAEPAIEGPAGVRALQMLRDLSGYMHPDFLSVDSNELQSRWESGEVAMAVGWNSRAEALTDTEGDHPAIAAATALAAAPTIGGGTTPAVSLWWNGFTVAKNISDEDAEASFRIMLQAISRSTCRGSRVRSRRCATRPCPIARAPGSRVFSSERRGWPTHLAARLDPLTAPTSPARSSAPARDVR